ncbi:MAG: hypothetical protein QG580_400 [Patescibacteria group bacterium]|jgi:hypothetical protein|nr:hypothetical protein [Patescibacteria group bacterium]
MKNIIIKSVASLFLTFMPVFVFAQAPNVNINYNAQSTSNNVCDNDIGSISELFDLAICILQRSVWPLLISLSVIVFIIGVIKYIKNGDDSKAREEGRNFMIYGIIGLFVMISVWGLVGVLQGTFGLGNSVFIPQLPQ